MSEMIDRVAKAMYEAGVEKPWRSWEQVGDNDKAFLLHYARVAITGMREPTHDMAVTGQMTLESSAGASVVWMDMIDKALEDK